MKEPRIPTGDFVVDHEAQPEDWPVKRSWLRSEGLVEGLWLTKVNQHCPRTIDVLVLNNLRVVVVNERVPQRRKIEHRRPQHEHQVGRSATNLHRTIMLKSLSVSSATGGDRFAGPRVGRRT